MLFQLFVQDVLYKTVRIMAPITAVQSNDTPTNTKMTTKKKQDHARRYVIDMQLAADRHADRLLLLVSKYLDLLQAKILLEQKKETAAAAAAVVRAE